MFQALQQALGGAVLERFTLLANHVLAAEPSAQQRLRPHAGRCIVLSLTGWPPALPALPALAFVVTPAGLLEWCGPDEPVQADLRLSVDASNPASLLARGVRGQRPPVEVSGDAVLAADVSWLMDHLRWDIEDDLARLVGAGPSREMTRIGGVVANGLRDAVKVFAGWGERMRPGPKPEDAAPR